MVGSHRIYALVMQVNIQQMATCVLTIALQLLHVISGADNADEPA